MGQSTGFAAGSWKVRHAARISESICSSNFLRAVQYEAVEDQGTLIPLTEA